jgi:hypothetical protein
VSRRADREGIARTGVGSAITLRYAHAFQLVEARLTARCGQVAYAKFRLRWARQLRLHGRGGDIDAGGFAPLP